MIRKEYQVGQWQFPFVAYFPDNMADNLPMIVQLHGAGERGNGSSELYKVDANGFSHILHGQKEFSCVFIMPQCSTDSFWVAEIPHLYEFILKAVKEFHIDSRRIYLTGLSMGGYGTWYTAMRHPELFAAIAPICGGGMVWNAGVLDMHIWAFHGTEDSVVYPTETINMINKIRCLKKNNHEVKMTLVDKEGHGVWDIAYQEQLLEWLLTKSK